MNPHPLEPLIERYLAQKDISPATMKSYKIAFKYYILYLKENKIAFAKTSDVIKYREVRRDLGHSSEYIYIQISALKGLYRYLKRQQPKLDLPVQYRYNIMEPIRHSRIKHQLKKPVLSVEEAKQLILKTKENRRYLWDYRDHAIVYLMVTAGLRSIEIVHAKRSDLNVIEGEVVLNIKDNTNTENPRFVKVSHGAKNAINAYLTRRFDANPYLFISHKQTTKAGHLSRTFFRTMFPKVLKKCGLENNGITPHCLRHTAALMNLLRGGSIESTRLLLRHKTIKSTLLYSNYLNRMNNDSESQIEQFILQEPPQYFYIQLNALFNQ